MDWMPGGEWGFKQMDEQRNITAPTSLTLAIPDVRNRANNARSQQAQRKQTASQTHSRYWDTSHPGPYEHWRFEYGWDLAFNDALAFFEYRSQKGLCGGDKIGLLDSWCWKRLRESGQSGQFLWEFEQGMRQGVKDFCECAGV